MASWSRQDEEATAHGRASATGQRLDARAWYSAPMDNFMHEPVPSIVGKLTANSDFPVTLEQRDAWIDELMALKSALHEVDGTILLEFAIPRMGRRADVIVLARSVVVVIEFKVGAASFDRDAVEQVWDYALDLKYFHRASHAAPIVPILVATEVPASEQGDLIADKDDVYRPLHVSPADLGAAVRRERFDRDGVLRLDVDLAAHGRRV